MHHIISALLLLITFTACAADEQQTWTVLGSNRQLTAHVDVSSFKRLSDGGVQVWTRIKYRSLQLTRAGREYDQVDRLSVYNCEDRTRRPVQLVMYKGKEVVDSERVGEDVIQIPPHSFAEATLNWACTQKIARR